MGPKVNTDLEADLEIAEEELIDLANDIKETLSLGRASISDIGKRSVFRARLSRIDGTHDKFLITWREVQRLLKKLSSSTDKHQTLKAEVKSAFYEALSIASEPSGEGETSNARSEIHNSSFAHNAVSFPKLPPISIPTFAGDISAWPTFRDIFLSLIHNNDRLDDIQKFHYLKLALKGSAAQTVNAISISELGYRQAWESITKKYDSKRIQATYYLMQILNFKPIAKASLSSLEIFSNVVLESVAAFSKLGLDDPAGFILTTLALRLVDPTTREQFERDQGSIQDPPSWEAFAKFIQQQIIRMQSGAMIASPRVDPPNSKIKTMKSVLLAAESPNNAPNCFVCSGSHRLYECSTFQAMKPRDRYLEIKSSKRCLNCLASGHTAASCPSKNRCRQCKSKHHSLLHFPNSGNHHKGNREKIFRSNTGESRKPVSSVPAIDSSGCSEKPSTSPQLGSNKSSTLSLSIKGSPNVLLGTAVARVKDFVGHFHEIRLLVDSGSQRSFLTSECAKRLGLPLTRNCQQLCAFGNQSIQGGKYQVECTLVPLKMKTPELHANAIVIERICGNMPSNIIPPEVVEHFESIELADPSFEMSRPVDFLLGADLFGDILTGDIVKSQNYPHALNTIFGWILMGNSMSGGNLSSTFLSAERNHSSYEELTCLMNKFWEIENVPNVSKINPLDAQCEDHFVSTHSRNEAGRYVVKLPFKTNTIETGSSKFVALTRFRNLEEKFHRSPELKSEYCKVIHDYLEKQYISRTVENGKYYLPHHGVLKDSTSTKLRIVFDASAPNKSGSLNDHLLVGPKLQRDIKDILLKFRYHRFVISADVCQMYLQILVHPDDRQYQHFFYRFESSDALQEFEFNRLSFGMSCSPFLAMRVLRQLIKDEGSEFPLASQAILNDMYIDDLLTGADTLEETLQLQSEVIKLLERGSFVLKKWHGNSEELLRNIPAESKDTTVSFYDKEDRVIKILGMQWEPTKDCLTYRVQTNKPVYTKRGIMSTIARMYDPLGYLAPAIFKAKALLQQLWELKLGWDEEVPPHIMKQWESYYNELPMLADVVIQRRILSEHPSKISIVGFADASSQGYAAVIYIHMESQDQTCTSRIFYAKTRLAPLKPLSIPRLELCAALLLVESLHALRDVLSTLGTTPIYLMSDSTVVLSWLNLPAHHLKTFVANRVAKILDLSSLSSWHHVRSEHNAADLGSRGLAPAMLPNHSLWWQGPDWLQKPATDWPIIKWSAKEILTELPEVKPETTLLSVHKTTDTNILDLIENFSSYTRLIRVFSYVRRFVNIIRSRTKEKIGGPLTLLEIRATEAHLVKMVQLSEGIYPLKQSSSLNIKSLSPFVDASGIVRVGGRLCNAPLSQDTKHPILLPPKSHFVNLIVDYYHLKHLHAGPQLLLSLLRQRYWIVSAKRIIRSRVHLCVTCHRFKAKGVSPVMGNLPPSRFEQGRAFLNAGVDFAGPYLIRESLRRKAALGKAYICIFVCMSTKAVHVELVSQLSSDAFLACLDRFIARRGLPSKVFSDNGTNFVGAARHLNELNKWWQSKEVINATKHYFTTRDIEWHFIPPLAPHFGGLWEAGVKSIKFHLTRILKSQPLTFEELSTVISRVEAVLNSRPLYALSSDPHDYGVLTPGHFLIGAPLVALPEPDLTDIPQNRLSRWQFLQRCITDLWKRWRLDYLTSMQQRVKWMESIGSLQVGSLVLLKNANVPPLQWPTGRILEVFPGDDGIVRVAKVKTPKGEYVRAVSHLAPLLPSES